MDAAILVGQIDPDYAVAHFGLVTPDPYPIRVSAYTGIQVKLPVMPRASHDTPRHFSAGQVPAGMWTGIADDNDPIRIGQPKDRQFPAVALDKRAAPLTASGQRDELNECHGHVA